MAENEKNEISDAEKELHDSIDAYVDAIVEDKEETYHNELESYEVHVQKIRDEVYKEMKEFSDSFLKGYEVLLEELAQQYSGGTSVGKRIPPGAIKL